MADFALATDGTQNYIACGTIPGLGTAMVNGVYAKFLFRTTSTALGEWGFVHTTQSSGFIIGFNEGPINTNTIGGVQVDIEDASGVTKKLRGHTTGTFSFNDGNTHTLEVIGNPGGSTITVNFDGVSKPITYENQDTLGTFLNFNASWDIGARYFNGGIGNFWNGTVDDFQLGVSSSNIYAKYNMDEGSGTTTVDSSGKGNTANLIGTPPPAWVTGLGAVKNIFYRGLLGVGL